MTWQPRALKAPGRGADMPFCFFAGMDRLDAASLRHIVDLLCARDRASLAAACPTPVVVDVVRDSVYRNAARRGRRLLDHAMARDRLHEIHTVAGLRVIFARGTPRAVLDDDPPWLRLALVTDSTWFPESLLLADERAVLTTEFMDEAVARPDARSRVLAALLDAVVERFPGAARGRWD